MAQNCGMITNRKKILLHVFVPFKNHSIIILTINRVNTIMDSDRVLIMHVGKVVEFDTPEALYQQADSMFFHLIDGKGE